MISTDSNTSRENHAATGTAGPRTRSCACGQQLDVCANEHCPRCGRTLKRR